MSSPKLQGSPVCSFYSPWRCMSFSQVLMLAKMGESLLGESPQTCRGCSLSTRWLRECHLSRVVECASSPRYCSHWPYFSWFSRKLLPKVFPEASVLRVTGLGLWWETNEKRPLSPHFPQTIQTPLEYINFPSLGLGRTKINPMKVKRRT